jgi:enoyl-CoA hydratase/carnithine racemase
MTSLADYGDKYPSIRMRREDGILEIQFHTNGDSLLWTSAQHTELELAFLDISRDGDNGVIIMTGTGENFSGPAVSEQGHKFVVNGTMNTSQWDRFHWEGRGLLNNLLSIEVPVISAINGPALRHAEIPVLADVVLAAEEATFQDTAHFAAGLVPGDGMHIVFPHVMGINRGRYFLLTGQTLSATEAYQMGIVNEILQRDRLLPRAWDIARKLMKQSALTRRYTRILLTHELKQRMHDLLGYGIALEGSAVSAIAHGDPMGRR